MIEPDHEAAGLDRDNEFTAGYLAAQLERFSLGQRLHTIGVYTARLAGEREAGRVAGVIERDQNDARKEAERKAAIIQVSEGLTVNIGNTVIEPTPEWLTKGEVRAVAVGGDRWTDMPMSTVRRVVTSHADRAFAAGRITSRQAKACGWYREQHEMSGLAGNVPSSSFEPRIASSAHSGAAFSPRQVDAQDELRNARLLIPMRLRTFFDRVVIGDIAITSAAKIVHAGKDPLDSFRCCADRVADYIEYSSGKQL